MFRFKSKSKSTSSREERSEEKHDIKRIIVCVDGTWYNADGKEGKGMGNVSNTYRVYASVKRGTFQQDGKIVKQVARYFHGIGVRTGPYDRYNDAIRGEGCKELIREVYQHCCTQVTSPDDELWLFGFSRGAYVVRAVSALFYQMATLNRSSTDQFHDDYKEALELMDPKHKKDMKNKTGQLHHFFTEKMRQGPVIQFLGLFDTVKKVVGDIERNISYSRSIRHARHALAMNEERVNFNPEVYEIEPDAGWDADSLVQAWFAGWHSDIGGGSKDDGLSLYPLQWMLFESQKYHLVLEYKPDKWIVEKAPMEHPPPLVLPGVIDETGSFLSYPRSHPSTTQQDDESIVSDDSQGVEDPFREWKFTYSNGIGVTMYDLRLTHKHGNLQERERTRLQKKPKTTHEVQLNPPEKSIVNYGRRPRAIFGPEELTGFNRRGPYGTIIHPSVYFLQDTYPTWGFGEALEKFNEHMIGFRDHLHPVGPSKSFPWLLEGKFKTKFQQIRILICGRSGVGKSTLLNRIFGIDLTEVNQDSRGVHDIDQGFESDLLPGVILHDSEGFEAGDSQRVQSFERFLKKHGSSSLSKQKLHAVWICNEMSTSRPLEKAFEQILDFIAQHAPELPVVFVGTKKDYYLKAEADLTLAQVRALETGEATKLDRAADAARDAEKKTSWKKQLEKVCEEASQTLAMDWTFVWRGNEESIKKLVKLTLKMLPVDTVRSGLAAAQVINREVKIESAIKSTMDLLRTAMTASSIAAITVILNRIIVPTYSRLLCNTIVRCYGITIGATSEADVAYIMSTVVWRNLGAFMGRSFFAGIGDISVLFVGAPFIEAPVVARMLIKCACDLIIILDRAFQIGGKSATKETVIRASREYLQPTQNFTGPSRKQLVHRQVNELIPAFSTLVVKIYQQQQIDLLRDGIERIVTSNRMEKLVIKLETDDDTPESSGIVSVDEARLAQNETGDSEDEEDLKELARIGHKDDVGSLVTGIAELSADTK